MTGSSTIEGHAVWRGVTPIDLETGTAVLSFAMTDGAVLRLTVSAESLDALLRSAADLDSRRCAAISCSELTDGSAQRAIEQCDFDEDELVRLGLMKPNDAASPFSGARVNTALAAKIPAPRVKQDRLP